MFAPDSARSSPAPAERPRPGGEESLRGELIAALDHDLRTSLTTILGALQTLAREQPAPADPDLAQLLASALAQAQHMRHLLDELPGAASLDGEGPLAPADLIWLVRGVTDTGDGGSARVEVPDDLPPVALPAPGLRRVLAGILKRAPHRGVRVEASGRGEDCLFTITTEEDRPPTVSPSARRLIAAMGGWIEDAQATGSPALRLVFPGAVRRQVD